MKRDLIKTNRILRCVKVEDVEIMLTQRGERRTRGCNLRVTSLECVEQFHAVVYQFCEILSLGGLE